MTIAACYVSNEGVVLGSDSSSTYLTPSGFRHLLYAQKIFEIGESGSSLGIVTWGRAGLPNRSYRQITAELSDCLLGKAPESVEEVGSRWIEMLWPEYTRQLQDWIAKYRVLCEKPDRTANEESDRQNLWASLFVGFCIGGHVRKNRTPTAVEILFMPGATDPPKPIVISPNQPRFWGMPNMMERLLKGIDSMVYNGIRVSPFWKGTVSDLDAIIIPHVLDANIQLPLRVAIDWIFSSIFITIKAMKFYKDPPFCGGSIEVAAITADRRFRWIRHKRLDQALVDHASNGAK
jgi:hypothetical protein